jgi:hypothetical protein
MIAECIPTELARGLGTQKDPLNDLIQTLMDKGAEAQVRDITAPPAGTPLYKFAWLVDGTPVRLIDMTREQLLSDVIFSLMIKIRVLENEIKQFKKGN